MSESRTPLGRVVAATMIGNALEWFDFLIYGYFAATIARTFFPSDDPFVSMLFATATFALSFLVRPLGGVLFGMYADRVGRKPALTVMIFVTGLATLLIGITPSYAAVGVFAPLLIITARIAQGLAVGGEFASGTALLFEYAPPHRKVLFGSFQMCSQALSAVLQGAIGWVLAEQLAPDSLESWGWRIPFVLGALIGPVGFYIRRHIDESPEFVRAQAQRATTKLPIRDVFATHGRAIVAGLGIVIVGTSTNYGWFVYLPVNVAEQLKIPFGDAMFGTMLCSTILFLLCPVTGALADRFGVRRVFLAGVIGYGLMGPPLVGWLLAAPSIERLLLTQLLCTLPISLIWGPTPGFLVGLFPVAVRSTGMSLCYNCGVLLFGGMAPFLLTLLTKLTGSTMVLAYYILLAAALSLAALLFTGAGRRGDAVLSPAPAT
jgi:MFS transporter, MHS family, proline/betaine transporter